MAKKDFSASTEGVFDAFFSTPTEFKKQEEPKKEIVKEVKKEIKKEVKKTEPAKNKQKKVQETTTKKKQQPKEIKKEEKITTPKVKTEEPKTTPKSYNKDCRYNFYLDTDLADFVTNYLWLTKNRSYSQYFNTLIKQDLLKILGLPADTSNEEMLKKWEEYKKENNI